MPSTVPPPPMPVSAPQDATCARHPDTRATGTCQRCGTFLCAQDARQVDLKVYCPECAARPDVDYLEAYRLQYWGKRDSWAWLFGFGGVLNILMGLALLAAALVKGQDQTLPMLGLSVVVLLAGVNNILFFAGVPFARIGAVAAIVVIGLFNVFTSNGAAIGGLVMPLAVTASVINSTRNKLFFKLEVSRADLKKAWDLFHNNTVARYATLLGVLGLLVPLVAPIALACGVVGLKRVDPDAMPPIGKKAHAIAGIVMGVLGTLGWGALGVMLLLRRG